MLTDLVQIRRLGEKNEKENTRFGRYLKRRAHSNGRLRRIAEEIHDQIDCTKCANCCIEGEAGISTHDITRLAKFLGVTNQEFREQFTMRADDNELILKRTASGCVFLKDNLCTVYEARPKSCALYPHLMRGDGSIESRMFYMVDRVPWCPIVYNWMESAKTETGFR